MTTITFCFLFRSLCEFVGDCFGPWYFSSGTALPQKNTSVQNNHLRFHTMTFKEMVRSYYCLIKVSGWLRNACYLNIWSPIRIPTVLLLFLSESNFGLFQKLDAHPLKTTWESKKFYPHFSSGISQFFTVFKIKWDCHCFLNSQL